MLQGKDLILATKKYAKENRRKSWYLTLSSVVIMLIAYAGALVNIHIIPQILCSILAGLMVVRMFIIYHDYLHKTILQNSIVAKAIFTVYGLFIMAPTSIWKRSHDYHHTHNSKLYTSSIGSFPLVTKKEFLVASNSERNIYLFIRHPLTITLGYIFAFFYGMCIRSLISNPKKHMDSLVAILFHFSIGILIFYFLGLQSLTLGLLIPALISSGMGSYLFYAQHNYPSAKYKPKEEWNYVYAALNSSSYMKMSKIMHWFTGNIGYHHIHHINAKIPFYKLPIVFKDMKELQHPGTTSLLPWDIYKCLKLKAWDPDTGKMIGKKEIYA